MKIALVGAGKFGTAIVNAMLGGKNEVTVIDKDPELIQRISDRYDVFTVQDDALDIDILKAIGIDKYDYLVAATESDEINMIVCKFAKELGCPQTIARVRAPRHMEQMDFIKSNMRIDYAINPDQICAEEIFRYLTQKYRLSGGRHVSGQVAILECEIEKVPGLVGKTLREVGPKLPEVLIAAVSRNGKVIIPNGSTMLAEGDTLYLIGAERKVNQLGIRIRLADNTTTIKKVMIAGGGKTGFYLARMLEDFGASIKIIENDRERCEYLSQQLENALVLNGDATDTNLLREENLDGMDAFVALTGFDEENLLLSLIAKQHGVDEVVTKISRTSYTPLTETLGVDMIINPMDMCATSILRYVEKDNIVLFSQVINGQAEFLEISAEKGMPLTEKTLTELDIPQGVLIAAVHRKGEIITPRGDTRIQPGDRVIILAMLSSAAELEGLLKR
jgi:trk system potassium uptake protein TrkA